MSNSKRSMAEVQAEYSRVCTQAGHAQYQVAVIQKDLESLNEKLKELNLEAASLAAAEAAASSSDAASDASAVSNVVEIGA